jgi:hypothetical protein
MQWMFHAGSDLRSVLEMWCDMAGWDLAWEAREIYPINASGVISGSFEDAVLELIAAFADLPRPPKATGYRRNNPPVLVVKTN